MNAPWPSEIWPFMPVSTTRPSTAIAYAATKMRSNTTNDGTIAGSTAITTTAIATGTQRPAFERISGSPLDALHRRAAEQAGRLHHQHHDDDRERGRVAQLVADRHDVGAE